MHDNRITEMVELTPTTAPIAKRRKAKADHQLHAAKDKRKKQQRAARKRNRST